MKTRGFTRHSNWLCALRAGTKDAGKANLSAGFTILELLVVLAIIGLLVSGALVGLNIARTKAQDARRMEDVRQIRNAIEAYSVVHNRFPIATTETDLTGEDAVSTALVSDDLIPAMPLDPRYPVSPYVYTYQSNSAGNTYILSFCLETDSISGYSSGCDNELTP